MQADELLGCAEALASPEIGSVEVLEAKNPFAESSGSDSFVTSAFNSRFSNTASMIRSQPRRSSAFEVAVMSSSGFSSFFRRSRILAAAFSCVTSFSTQATPRTALA